MWETLGRLDEADWGRVHPMHLLSGSHDLVAAKDPNEQSHLKEALSASLSPPQNNSGWTQRSSRTLHPRAHATYRSHMPFDCAPNCGPWNICTRIQNLLLVCLWCSDPDTGCNWPRRLPRCRKNCRTSGKWFRHHSILLGTCTFCLVTNRHRWQSASCGSWGRGCGIHSLSTAGSLDGVEVAWICCTLSCGCIGCRCVTNLAPTNAYHPPGSIWGLRGKSRSRTMHFAFFELLSHSSFREKNPSPSAPPSRFHQDSPGVKLSFPSSNSSKDSLKFASLVFRKSKSILLSTALQRKPPSRLIRKWFDLRMLFGD